MNQKHTTGEVAAMLGTSVWSVRRLIESGALRAERLTDEGQYRILDRELREYAQRRGIQLMEQQAQK